MFDSLFDVLISNLEKINSKRVKLSNDLEEYHDENSNYIIKNWLFKSSKYRKWRITRLDGGDKIQVFNTVGYPKFSSELPIFGVDILWFGSSKKLLAVLDYQPLVQDKDYLDKYCKRIDYIKKQYREFDNTKMKNVYDSSRYFSPWVILCRGDNNHLDKYLHKVFDLFLNEYLKMYESHSDNYFLNNEQIEEKHIDYDVYSSEKDPASKLFKSFFGELWTRNFIKNYLFTLSSR